VSGTTTLKAKVRLPRSAKSAQEPQG
jgi:hypothetical protein